ncbi:MAG: T9SS type A sorting domain-containing protein [Flavobacteriaceae bacterium]|nr:T9SS type A sorting domain-containing protein [Flavobacteriaceae bacterium]
MKRILLSVIALGFVTFGSAQTVIFEETFAGFQAQDDFPLGWQNIDADGDGNNWGIYQVQNSQGVPVTPMSAISRSWQGAPLMPDNWLILPALDLSGAEGGTITLEFVTQVAAAAWDEEHIAVYGGTTDDLEALLTGGPVQWEQTLGDAANTGTPTTHTIDLTPLAGQNPVYIAFRHYNSFDMDYVAINNMRITGSNMSTIDLIGSSDVSIVYPNPAKDQVRVKLAQNFDAAKTSVTLTNMSGKLVANFANMNDINISHLPAGVYILTLTDGKQTETKKLIKK